MEDLFNLGGTDSSMFDNISGSFDIENALITSPPAPPLYASEVPPHMRAHTDVEFISVEENPAINKTPTPTPPTSVKQETAEVPALSAQQVPQQPENAASQNPVDDDRRRLRPVAESIVSESWRLGRTPPDFIAATRLKLVHTAAITTLEDSSDQPAIQLMSSTLKSEPMSMEDNAPESLWSFPPASEGALLDALFSKIVNSEAPSTRFMSYLSYALLTGGVSQRAVVSAYISWASGAASVSDRVMKNFAVFFAEVIPNYCFSMTDSDLTAEAKDFLTAFISVVNSTAKSPSIAPTLVQMLNHDRTVALVRACLRKLPTMWVPLNAAIAQLETAPPGEIGISQSFAPQSAFAEASELKELVQRLRRGLCAGIKTLEQMLSSITNIAHISKSNTDLPGALNIPYAVTVQVFGNEVASALRDLWSQIESPGGDIQHLSSLVRATKPSTPSHPQPAQKYGFAEKVRACEAVVRFLAEKASMPGAAEMWRGVWGGTQRLQRVIRDAVPQVKNEIATESSALIVATAVVCCAAMCLGPSLRIEDGNDGIEITDLQLEAQQQAQNQQVDETIGELTSFAVNSLESAAVADETPVWKSFGLWLLLLMSRAGCMLRASGCDHVRAVKVIRAWGGMPIGTPGAHASHGTSAHKHSQSGSGHQQSQQSSSSMAHSEGVALFSSSASLAIIDASDVSGNDETIRSLCEDLVQ
ncbi:hypothetical protein BWQ96_06148 [Gracilariopsis chorda]|uniref:Uncharacterized protein n=1 Tax=Gracilariopsis chorda TaxID=448386 RepID=A0A2V3IPT3_9FLOR|nr:hypothetical protein BWQ96_06148 [Gracilariopsis chorda]|eukprot:PXF44067.1 hypothetical protein BWQ96_06148 [Gracilariopsis chorda]